MTASKSVISAGEFFYYHRVYIVVARLAQPHRITVRKMKVLEAVGQTVVVKNNYGRATARSAVIVFLETPKRHAESASPRRLESMTA